MSRKNKTIDAEIVPANQSPTAIQRMQTELQAWRQRALEAESQLRELQGIESAGNIEEHQRMQIIRSYLVQLENLNRKTPGGLRSQPIAEEDESQELLNEAWLIYCDRRRGGSARF